MAQRKGNLHVKDRSSDLGEGPGRSRYYDRCKLARLPTAPGDLTLTDEGNGESATELASPSRVCQGTKSGGGKAPPGAGQYPFQRLSVEWGQPAG